MTVKKRSLPRKIPKKTSKRGRQGLQLNSILGHSDSTAESGLLNNIINQIGDELVIINNDGRIVYVNDAVVQAFGYPLKEILNRKITDFFKSKMTIREWKRSQFSLLKRFKKPVSYQLERVVKSGAVQVIDVTVVYMSYRGQELVLSVGRDVTRQLAMQESLKESEDLYRLLSEGAGDGIFMADLKGRITYVNRALEQMVGIPLKVSKGKIFHQYVSESSLKKAVACFNMARKGGVNLQENIELLCRGGGVVPVEINVSPLYRDGRIVSVHAIMRDIRGRKQYEQLVAESEKMKAMQYFVSGTAQELKHPLQAVMKRTKDLVKKYRDRPFEYIGFNEFRDLMRTLKSISDQIRYCYATTERLLTLNQKKVKLSREGCDVNRVIREIVELRSGDLKVSEIKRVLRLTKYLPPVAFGEIEMNQVLGNVINNAIQAMPAGGALSLCTGFDKVKNSVRIVVKDNGVGIARDSMAHIFEPFYTTRQRGVNKNSGLGLPIVYSLLKAAQGDIKVESSLRKGTIVKITLPASKPVHVKRAA